jgi:hypothetical protein
VYKKHTSQPKTHKTKLKGWEKIYYTCETQTQAGVAVLITKEILSQIKSEEIKEDHCILIKGII